MSGSYDCRLHVTGGNEKQGTAAAAAAVVAEATAVVVGAAAVAGIVAAGTGGFAAVVGKDGPDSKVQIYYCGQAWSGSCSSYLLR